MSGQPTVVNNEEVPKTKKRVVHAPWWTPFNSEMEALPHTALDCNLTRAVQRGLLDGQFLPGGLEVPLPERRGQVQLPGGQQLQLKSLGDFAKPVSSERNLGYDGPWQRSEHEIKGPAQRVPLNLLFAQNQRDEWDFRLNYLILGDSLFPGQSPKALRNDLSAWPSNGEWWGRLQTFQNYLLKGQ